MNRNVNSEQTSGIAMVDLAYEGRAEYEKIGPPNYRRLDQLHKSVTKASPAPLIAHQKPAFSYIKGDRPRFNFLGKATEAHGTPENLSSDDDNTWMDDFPSLSAIIAPEGSAHSPVGSTKGSIATTNYDVDDSSELEAGMIGLDDSMALSQWTSKNAMDTLPSSLEQAYGMEALEDDMGNGALAPSMARTHGSRLSTVSPNIVGRVGAQCSEDAIATSNKRTLADMYNDKTERKATQGQQEQGGSIHNPNAKKPKTATEASAEPPLLSMGLESQAAVVPTSPAEEIPRGLEDIDPDILAMFKDVVDFV